MHGDSHKAAEHAKLLRKFRADDPKWPRWEHSRDYFDRLMGAIAVGDCEKVVDLAFSFGFQCCFEDRAYYWRGRCRDAAEAATAAHDAFSKLLDQRIAAGLLTEKSNVAQIEELFDDVESHYLVPRPEELTSRRAVRDSQQNRREILLDEQLRSIITAPAEQTLDFEMSAECAEALVGPGERFGVDKGVCKERAYQYGVVRVLANADDPEFVRVVYSLVPGEPPQLDGFPGWETAFEHRTMEPVMVAVEALKMLGDEQALSGVRFLADVAGVRAAILIADEKVTGIRAWRTRPLQAIKLGAGDALVVPTRKDHVFVHLVYRGGELVRNEPSVLDMYQTHSDFDQIEFIWVGSGNLDISNLESGMPSEYDDSGWGSIVGAEWLQAGERLVWVSADGAHLAVIEASDLFRVVCRSYFPTMVHGFPGIWNILERTPSDAVVEKAQRAFLLKPPRTWAPR